MKNNVNGKLCLCLFESLYWLVCFLVLVNNLYINIKPMYRLYSILKDWEKPPTIYKILYASDKKKFDWNTKSKYNKQLKSTLENIKKVFEN